jgi:hypothetical protein
MALDDVNGTTESADELNLILSWFYGVTINQIRAQHQEEKQNDKLHRAEDGRGTPPADLHLGPRYQDSRLIVCCGVATTLERVFAFV